MVIDAVHRVTLQPSGWGFDAGPGQTLVASAAAAGLVLPVSCRNGTCRTCLCQATSGSVAYRIDWPGVSADEKAEGWILPCVAHATSDLVIEQPRARRSAAD